MYGKFALFNQNFHGFVRILMGLFQRNSIQNFSYIVGQKPFNLKLRMNIKSPFCVTCINNLCELSYDHLPFLNKVLLFHFFFHIP
jgi:hypothetical protein